MGYIEKNLLQNEDVTYKTKLHWITYLGPLLLILVGGGCFWFASILENQNLVGMLNICEHSYCCPFCILWFLSINRFHYFRILVSQIKELSLRFGFIKRNTYELLLNKVESFQVEQSILGRLLGFGTILVAGTGMGSETFNNIDDPLELKKNVQQSVKEYEREFSSIKYPCIGK